MRPYKYIVPALMLLFTLLACAMGSRKPVVRKDQDALWRPCQEFELADKTLVGWMCSRYCTDRDGSKCKSWKTRKRNFCEASDYRFFRDGGFITIDEDNL